MPNKQLFKIKSMSLLVKSPQKKKRVRYSVPTYKKVYSVYQYDRLKYSAIFKRIQQLALKYSPEIFKKAAAYKVLDLCYIKDETGKTDWEKLDFLPGLGFIKGFCVPHYDTKSESDRMYFNALLKKRGVTGYALDNCAAIIFDNGKISTITSQPNKNIYCLNPIQAKTRERD